MDINCAALPATSLFESELFGYAPARFTGASRNGKIGLFELANGGTLFWMKLPRCTLAMQSKLLRVLQEQTIRRLGDNKNIPLDVGSSQRDNRDILHAVETGVFSGRSLLSPGRMRSFKSPASRAEGGDRAAGCVFYGYSNRRKKNKKEIRITREAERIAVLQAGRAMSGSLKTRSNTAALSVQRGDHHRNTAALCI